MRMERGPERLRIMKANSHASALESGEPRHIKALVTRMIDAALNADFVPSFGRRALVGRTVNLFRGALSGVGSPVPEQGHFPIGQHDTNVTDFLIRIDLCAFSAAVSRNFGSSARSTFADGRFARTWAKRSLDGAAGLGTADTTALLDCMREFVSQQMSCR